MDRKYSQFYAANFILFGPMLVVAPGGIAQSVMCLATDVCLENIISRQSLPGVTSSIPARSQTFVEIDHEIISMVILPLPLQLQAKVLVCARRTGKPLAQTCPGKKVLNM